MNPARTLGPDIVAVNFTGWWVHVVGDLVGACLAVTFINLVRGRRRASFVWMWRGTPAHGMGLSWG